MPIIEPERQAGIGRRAVWIGLAVVVLLVGVVVGKSLWTSGTASGSAGSPARGSATGSATASSGSPSLTAAEGSRTDPSTSAGGDRSAGGSAASGAVGGSAVPRTATAQDTRGETAVAGTSRTLAPRGHAEPPGPRDAGTRPGTGSGWPPSSVVPSASGGLPLPGGARTDASALPPASAGPTGSSGTASGTRADGNPAAHAAGSDAHPDGTGSHVESAPTNTDPASDITPPTVQGIHFEPPQVSDGGSSTVFLQVTDDLSGVKTITGSFRSPSGSAILPFEAVSDGGGTYFTAKFTIPARAETGAWYVATLYVLDRAGNSQLLSFTPQTSAAASTLMVSSSESDSTPPTVTEITLDKSAVRDGEKDVIHIRADDDRSGVATIWGSFQSASRTALLGFSCQLDPGSGLWEGEIQIPANADCGEWNLQQLRVTDKAGNLAVLQGENTPVAHVAFEVVGRSDCDSSAPTLEAIEISPSSLSNETGGEVVVTATVHDIGSGTNSVVGWLSGPVDNRGQTPKLQFSCQKPGDPDAPWVGRFQLPRFAAKGIWRVALLRLFDNAHNMRDYAQSDATLAGATLEVQ